MRPDFRLGVEATERALLYIALAFRVGGLFDLFTWLPVSHERQWVAPALMTLITVESAAVFLVYIRRGAIAPARLAAGDAVFVVAVMLADLALTGNAETHEWGYWIRNFAMASLVGIVIGVRSWRAAAIAVVSVTGTYWFCMWAVGGHDPYPFYRTMSFAFDGVGGFAVARFLRPRAVALDEAHQRAVVGEAELSRARDRSARAASLHDKILQTLEVLAVSDAVTDPELRKQVAADAGWLRRFVQEEHDQSPSGVESALCEVIDEVTRRHGLKIEFHSSQLRALDTEVPPAIVTAITGAVGEALTNVAKHSGTDRAVVHCEVGDGVLSTSVVDQGDGFRAEHREGAGIRQSLRRRIADVGGQVQVYSAPGAGTVVEIDVRWSGQNLDGEV